MIFCGRRTVQYMYQTHATVSRGVTLFVSWGGSLDDIYTNNKTKPGLGGENTRAIRQTIQWPTYVFILKATRNPTYGFSHISIMVWLMLRTFRWAYEALMLLLLVWSTKETSVHEDNNLRMAKGFEPVRLSHNHVIYLERLITTQLPIHCAKNRKHPWP